MKILSIISRGLLGVLFIFSGFVKALDPLGSAYKFGDYFHAFGLEFLDGISLPLGIFLSAFELVLGLTLILGYQKRITYWVLLVFMSFFTLLTFVLALTNPVTDCGCFGDAIIMTNWETFFKNIVFMVFVLILFMNRNNVQNELQGYAERGLILLFFLGCFMFSLHAVRHLPILDFRPYDIGTHIPDGMIIPDGAPTDVYETILFYKNMETGDTEEFTLENYPQDTILYSFVTSESKLISKGYEPPIHDFGITDPSGNDITDILLDFPGYSLLMIGYDLEESDEDILYNMNQWETLASLADDFQFIPVTASATSTINEVIDRASLTYDFYSADEIMLKTVVRSNPGMVLLKNGTIMGKWAGNDFPPVERWNPKWVDMIQQYQDEQDPEILMLIEEGLMDEIRWDVIDFDRSASGVVASGQVMRSDRLVWTGSALGILFLIVVLQFLPNLKQVKRD